MTSKQIVGAISAASLFAAVTAGCASAPPPTERLASAEAAVRAAREVGAERVPTAELQVKLADEEIQKARALAKAGENERAESMLQRASSDAELALALAREGRMRAEAQRPQTTDPTASPVRERGPEQ